METITTIKLYDVEDNVTSATLTFNTSILDYIPNINDYVTLSEFCMVLDRKLSPLGSKRFSDKQSKNRKKSYKMYMCDFLHNEKGPAIELVPTIKIKGNFYLERCGYFLNGVKYSKSQWQIQVQLLNNKEVS